MTQEENNLITYDKGMGKNLPPSQAYLFTLSDVLQLDLQYKWVVEDVLGVGESFLVIGQSGAWKSTLGLNMILQLMTPNEKFLDTFAVNEANRPKKCLIVQAENAMPALRKNVERMCSERPSYKNCVSDIHMLSFGITGKFRVDFAVPADIAGPYIQALYNVKPDLILIDPLQCFHSAEENDSVSMRTVLDNMQQMTEAVVPDANIVLVHHDGKTVNKKAAGRGSSAITDWAANFIRIEKMVKARNNVSISFGKKRNAPDDDQSYKFLRHNLFFVPMGASSKKVNPYEAIVVQAITESGGKVTGNSTLVGLVSAKAKALHLPASPVPVRTKIDELVNAGKIVATKSATKAIEYTVKP